MPLQKHDNHHSVARRSLWLRRASGLRLEACVHAAAASPQFSFPASEMRVHAHEAPLHEQGRLASCDVWSSHLQSIDLIASVMATIAARLPSIVACMYTGSRRATCTMSPKSRTVPKPG